VGANNVAFTLGVSITTASETALIYAAVPIWGILLGLALGLERPTRWGILGVCLAASYTMLFGGLGALPLALPGFLDAGWVEASARAWEALAYSTLLVAAFGFWAWQRGVSQVGENRVLVYQYLITLVGVAAGVMLLGESLTANKVLGGAVILLGVYLARRR
jgi:drug/metabolite transporter (DMT)-like permease